MKYLIFVLVIAMCFGFNEGISCKPNTLEFQNKLNPGSILKVNCSTNTNIIEPLHEVKVNGIYQILVNEKISPKRIVWRCLLRYGEKVENSLIMWRAYRGARSFRCGEKRSWIVRIDGIYLEKNNKAKGLQHHWIVPKQ
ncbi:hypothetical protein BRARA_F03428 [Brassica rapa]|uniref:Uncharacterized protein n=1 Tax=Brassica campestris TaxID=3711 RepID=A0A397ZA66_BRACM|nr:hypothetical protein BRARA_F03428 [Brassica rapa]